MYTSRILVEISTKDRDPILGSVIFGLIQQTYKEWDLLIINDGSREVGYSNAAKFAIRFARHAGHEVSVIDGSHISQAHNHNMALYGYRQYKYIMRCDDDLPFNKFTLEYLYETITSFDDVAAVGGLWFDVNPPEYFGAHYGDRQEIIGPVDMHPACTGKVDSVNSNWQQRMYHSTSRPFSVEHVYSNCMYDTEKMREVGGWPEVYSRGVAHGEETDGTYRLYLAGYKLLVDPRVTGNHLRVGGGIRSTRDVKQVQSMDLLKWQSRLPQIKGINFKPTVAVACPNHQYGLGGAERLFYDTVRLLQQNTELEVHPVFTGKHYDSDQCNAAFGFRFEDAPELLSEYDIGIVIGHELNHPFGMDGFPRARQLIHYTLFPIEVNKTNLSQFGAFVGISEYSRGYIQSDWGVKARVIYPAIEPGCANGPKENIVLVVSRCVPAKAPLWLMQKFVEFGLDEYELHVVSSTSVDEFEEYEQQVDVYARSHPNIFLHKNVSGQDLNGLYRRAKVLWTANGMMSTDPAACEHFGYTPPESFASGCIPIVFDRGGHKETVSPLLRWDTKEELERITKWVLGKYGRDFESALSDIGLAPGDTELVKFFDDVTFSEQWEDAIRRVNALAIQHERVEQIQVSGKIKIAMMSDSPYLPEYDLGVTTGFGVVAGQIVKEIIKQPDMELNVFGMLDSKYVRTDRSLPFNLHIPLEDMEAVSTLPRWIQAVNPDVIFMIQAPGDMYSRVQQLRHMQIDTPIVAYFPVEGSHRINPSIPDLLKSVQYPVTYCKNGSDMIFEHTGERVPWAHHGADHAPFAPLDPGDRQHIREILGWEDKYVVGFFSTNKRVKNFPVLIRSMRKLLEQGVDDVLMYFHTMIYDSHRLQGWNLGHIANMESTEEYPTNEHIIFPMIGQKFHGVAFDSTGIETWKLTPPTTEEGKLMLLSSLPLITRYSLLDLYFDASSAEGHGLGSLEAAACGVDVVSVNDGVARSEIHSQYCHMISPKLFDTWTTGTDLALLDPRDVALTIRMAKSGQIDFPKDNPERLRKDMPWEKTAKLFVDKIREAASR